MPATKQDCVKLQNSAVMKHLTSFLSHLEPEQVDQIIHLMYQFSSLFSDVPGRTTIHEHDIDVGSAKPIKQHSYRVNPVKRHIMKTEVEYMLRHGASSTQPESMEFTLPISSQGRWNLSFLYRLSQSERRHKARFFSTPTYGGLCG